MNLLKITFLSFVLLSFFLFTFILSTPAYAQLTLPISYYYTNPLLYPSYSYFNTINSSLLGSTTFTPFLTSPLTTTYNLAGIPTYPYVASPYQTTFPYTTLPGTISPYTSFNYPSLAFASPTFYLNWVLLQ